MVKRQRRIDKDLLFCILFLIFPTLQFILFYIGVNFNSVLLSFKNYDGLAGKYFYVGAQNFKRVWDELVNTAILKIALMNSLKIWFWGSIVGPILSLLFSYYIFKKALLSKTFKVLLFLPQVLPNVLCVVIFKFFTNESIPAVYDALFGKELIGLLVNPSTRYPTIIFFMIWYSFGAQILVYSGTMNQISVSVIEAGKIDGATPMVEFFRIVLPQIKGTIFTFFIASVVQIFTNQANLYTFFGEEVNYSEYTIGYYLFVLANKRGAERFAGYPYASALGLCSTLIAIPLCLGLKKLMSRWED